MVSVSKSAGHGAASGNAALPGTLTTSFEVASPSSSDRKRPSQGAGLLTRAEGGLSFVLTTRDRRGRIVKRDAFAVPDEDYEQGWITGLKVMGELLAELQRTGVSEGYGGAVYHTLLQAAECSNQRPVPPAQADRVGAATAFLRTVEVALQFFATHADHQRYIADYVAQLTESRQQRADKAVEARRQFVERMRAARQAKREARHG